MGRAPGFMGTAGVPLVRQANISCLGESFDCAQDGSKDGERSRTTYPHRFVSLLVKQSEPKRNSGG